MTLFSGIVALLAIALIIWPILLIARLPISKNRRIALSLIRGVLVILLVAAFIEPSFILERLPGRGNDIAVLFDNSKSMRLFSDQTRLEKIADLMQEWNRSQGADKGRFTLYTFGDTLNLLDLHKKFSLNETRSFFPVIPKIHGRTPQNTVIISDGNWTNPSLPFDDLANQTLLVAELPRGTIPPFAGLEIHQAPASIPIDSTARVRYSLEAVSPFRDTAVINIICKNRIIATMETPVDSGYFKKSFEVNLPSTIAGHFVYRFSAALKKSALSATKTHLLTVVPTVFTYTQYSAEPTLDKRFITLSLQNTPGVRQWSERERSLPDALLCYAWDGTAEKALTRLKPNGIVICIGCLPWESTKLSNFSQFKAIIPGYAQTSWFFDKVVQLDLPPPEQILMCNSPQFKKLSSILVGTVLHNKKTDTLDIIRQGEWNGRPIMVCCAKGIWQWDFRPLGLQTSEEQVFPFSVSFVRAMKDLLEMSSANELVVYPATDLIESDSLSLGLLAPSSMVHSSEVALSYSISQSENTLIDTQFTVTFYGNGKANCMIKPLSKGTYFLNAALTGRGKKLTYRDTLVVQEDRLEYQVPEQNRELLNEIGQPFNLDSITDIASISNLLQKTTNTMREPIKETVQIKKSWYLIIAFILLYFIEIALRRKWSLD